MLRLACAATIDAIGADRTSVHLSPNEPIQGVDDSDPQALFAHAARLLSDLGIAFLEIREPKPDGTYTQTKHPPLAPLMRSHFSGPFVLNLDFSLKSAEDAIASGEADAVSFGTDRALGTARPHA